MWNYSRLKYLVENVSELCNKCPWPFFVKKVSISVLLCYNRVHLQSRSARKFRSLHSTSQKRPGFLNYSVTRSPYYWRKSFQFDFFLYFLALLEELRPKSYKSCYCTLSVWCYYSTTWRGRTVAVIQSLMRFKLKITWQK